MSNVQTVEIQVLVPNFAKVLHWANTLDVLKVEVHSAVSEVLKNATTNQLTDMAASACVLLDFFQCLAFEAQPVWLPDLLALDMWIEDELDRRMAGNDEMENGA